MKLLDQLKTSADFGVGSRIIVEMESPIKLPKVAAKIPLYVMQSLIYVRSNEMWYQTNAASKTLHMYRRPGNILSHLY